MQYMSECTVVVAPSHVLLNSSTVYQELQGQNITIDCPQFTLEVFMMNGLYKIAKAMGSILMSVNISLIQNSNW